MKRAIQLVGLILVVLCGMAAAGTSYTVRDLGQLKGGSATPLGISANGLVVGNSGDPHGGTTHAFFWPGTGSIRDLGTLPGGDYSTARAVNDAGQVVGSSNTSDHVRAFVWTQASGMKDLGTLPGDDSAEAWDINANSLIAGYSSGPNGMHAVVWNNGQVLDLGTLPGDTGSQAFAINDTGQVSGISSGPDGSRGFLWTPGGGMEAIGPTSDHTTVLLLNNQATAVGYVRSGNVDHAFVWTSADGLVDIGTLPGGDYSQASGINNSGQVVGASGSSLGTHAFIWSKELGMQDLNNLLPGGGSIVLSAAVAINDQGQIVCYGAPHANPGQLIQLDHTSHAGPLHVYLLTPGQ